MPTLSLPGLMTSIKPFAKSESDLPSLRRAQQPSLPKLEN